MFQGSLIRAQRPKRFLQSSRQRHRHARAKPHEFPQKKANPKVNPLSPFTPRAPKSPGQTGKDPKSRLIDQLLEEIDELKEQANVREMKLETINFRCEKLQEEITKKHEQMALLKNKNIELTEQILELNGKLEKAVRENRINREDVGPRLDALRSRYEVCMLEMVSLENDNRILSERNQEILRQDTELRKINRELKKEKFEEKQERLELCKEFEKVKREFEQLNEKLEDMRVHKEELEENVKRLKNDRESSMRKIEILEKENFRLMNLKNQNKLKEIDRVVDSKDTVFMDFSERRKTKTAKLSNMGKGVGVVVIDSLEGFARKRARK